MISTAYNFGALNYSVKWVPGSPGREPTISRMSQREAVRRAILADGNQKVVASASGVCPRVVSTIAGSLGFRRMYVTAAERATIMQSRQQSNVTQNKEAA